MSQSSFSIREICQDDNPKIEIIIRAIFPEFSLPMEGSSFEDTEISNMFEAYQGENETYFIIEEDAEIIGGAGIKPLKDHDVDVCELQKMYFSPKARGKGYGKILLETCLERAKALGYKQCYLESASQLEAAIHIYTSYGFNHLDKPLGNTGHYVCGVWMLKELI